MRTSTQLCAVTNQVGPCVLKDVIHTSTDATSLVCVYPPDWACKVSVPLHSQRIVSPACWICCFTCTEVLSQLHGLGGKQHDGLGGTHNSTTSCGELRVKLSWGTDRCQICVPLWQASYCSIGTSTVQVSGIWHANGAQEICRHDSAADLICLQ